MKRAILVILTILAVAIVALTAGGVFDVTGVARILVVAGAVLLMVASVDGLRSLKLAGQIQQLPESPPVPGEAAAVEAPAVEAPADVKPPVEVPALLPVPQNVIDLRGSPRLVDELIANGVLTATSGPILDREVAPLVMLAMVDPREQQATAAA